MSSIVEQALRTWQAMRLEYHDYLESHLGQMSAFTICQMVAMSRKVCETNEGCKEAFFEEGRQMKSNKTLISVSLYPMVFFGTIPANASTETGEVVDLGGQTIELGSDGVIVGGHVQSEDPTRYDYVPETSNDDERQAFNASGVQTIPAFTISAGAGGVGVPVPIPAGYLGHEIVGTKLKVTQETAFHFRFSQASTPWNIALCDVRFDFQNRSSAGAIYKTYPGATKWGCFNNWLPTRTDNVTRTLKAGKQCARLYVGGAYRGEQCHTIKP